MNVTERKSRAAKTRYRLWPLLLAFGLGACASTSSPVRVDKADVDFSRCRTFDWLATSSEAASFTEQRVRTAVMAELQSKGYAQSADKPDCRITYVLSIHERSKPKPNVGVGVGAGGGSGGIGGGIGVNIPIGRKNAQAGTFTLDVVDVSSNSQVWSGSIDASFAAVELTEDEAREAVRKILAEFPDRAPSSQ